MVLWTIPFFAVSCSNDPKDIKAIADRFDAMKSNKVDGVRLIWSSEGRTRAELKAPMMVQNNGAKPPYVEMAKGVFVQFYDDSLKPESSVSARYGRYFETENNVLLKDSVVIHSKKGESLMTEELVWNDKQRKFLTEKFVKITTPTQIIYGYGMESNEDFTNYRIKNVKGVIQVKKEEIPAN
jgi:LPS export ABC transporter protein LptC